MISVDISNIWCSVSLPDLLQEEKNVFDAHMALGGRETKYNPWFGWLDVSNEARRTWVNPVITAAERIRQTSQILVIVGGGLPAAAARAAIRLLPGHSSSLRLLFVGEDYSSEKWLRVVQTLEGADFSVLAASPGKNETATLVTLRSLRWIMDKRYGTGAKDRIYIAAPTPGCALSRLADALGCTKIPMPNDAFAPGCALNPMALLIMAAAGISPGLVYTGAAEFGAQCDIRSFDNPLWLYATARKLLHAKGYRSEVVCTTNPSAESLGAWWMRTMAATGSKNGQGPMLSHARLPEDFFCMGDTLLQPGLFASVLRFPVTGRKVSVETDWKNLDGLNALSGQEFSTMESQTLDAITDAFVDTGVPYISIECDEVMTDDTVGQLLCFFEMSAALSASLMGTESTTQPLTESILSALDQKLGRN